MSLALALTNPAISPGIISYAYASVGTAPYVYSVLPGGVGGTIDSSSGLYTPPSSIGNVTYDQIQVSDLNGGIAYTSILVGDPLILFCDIIQQEMGLANGRVYLWDQKIMKPTDRDIYIPVSIVSCKPFSNSNQLNSDGTTTQSTNMQATIQVDIISRGPAARTRKEEIILALNSDYAQSQQEKNSFYIGKIPAGSHFVNLSEEDGSAIPYRFSISVNLQYFVTKSKTVPYFSTFSTPNVLTNS
jgi:hypothetical protein